MQYSDEIRFQPGQFKSNYTAGIKPAVIKQGTVLPQSCSNTNGGKIIERFVIYLKIFCLRSYFYNLTQT